MGLTSMSSFSKIKSDSKKDRKKSGMPKLKKEEKPLSRGQSRGS